MSEHETPAKVKCDHGDLCPGHEPHERPCCYDTDCPHGAALQATGAWYTAADTTTPPQPELEKCARDARAEHDVEKRFYEKRYGKDSRTPANALPAEKFNIVLDGEPMTDAERASAELDTRQTIESWLHPHVAELRRQASMLEKQQDMTADPLHGYIELFIIRARAAANILDAPLKLPEEASGQNEWKPPVAALQIVRDHIGCLLGSANHDLKRDTLRAMSELELLIAALKRDLDDFQQRENERTE
jgi:hypothetical protein